MKKITALILALVCAICAAVMPVSAADDGLVKQDIDYTEVKGRVNQVDSGFTISSKYIYSGSRHEGEAPLNESGFQFYYLGLERWSTDAGGTDGPIDQWYLDWLDASLANLRANGGGCLIRATYALDGKERQEPQTFEMLLKHQKQLCGVFAKYPDLITAVECGMIGAFGEMWGGKYSNQEYKSDVLDGWLTNLPDAITVNVRTTDEYVYYVNYSPYYKENFRNKIIDGVRYPATIHRGNIHEYSFAGSKFARIGCYNDAMIQNSNDGGTFYSSRDVFRAWIGGRGTEVSYGGEFSGAADVYRWGDATWLPLNAIPEFYVTHLSYYHGGNNAYKYTGRYYDTYTNSKVYDSVAEAEEGMDTFFSNMKQYGSGMEHDAVLDGTTVTYTTGGWANSTYGTALIAAIAEAADATADMDDYKGESVGDFFDDHVGYRIVLRESYLSDSVAKGGVLRVKGALDNVGFANITRDKVTEIVITDGTNTYVAATDIDCGQWLSAQRSAYDIELKLPGSIPAGEYTVYMRTAGVDQEGKTAAAGAVRFCNPGQFRYDTLASTYSVGAETLSIIYDSKVCGNYLGIFTVTEDAIPASDDTFKQVATSFEDVAEGKYYTETVTKACGLGLMNGVSATAFNPTGDTSRGQFVTVLYRMEGEPSVADLGKLPFSDVPEEKFYTDAVKWAYANGVVNGTSDTAFSPNGKLTREQFATMLYRYAEYKKVDVSAKSDLSVFSDESSIAGYAKSAMSWANAEGYITGYEADDVQTMKPKNKANRAQLATILVRYLEKVSAK